MRCGHLAHAAYITRLVATLKTLNDSCVRDQEPKPMVKKPVPVLLCTPTGGTPTTRMTPERATTLRVRGRGKTSTRNLAHSVNRTGW